MNKKEMVGKLLCIDKEDKSVISIIGMVFVFCLLFIFGIIIFVSPVSAYSSGSVFDASSIRQGSQSIIDFMVNWASPFLQAIFGGNDYTGELLFEKVMLFILFFSFIWVSLSQVKAFKEQKNGKVIIGLVVGILAVRYMDAVWIMTIISRYEVLGIAVTSIIPFIMYFFFINGLFSDNAILRKMGWLFFTGIYVGLYFTNTAETYTTVYFWTAIASLVFLFMDGSIQKMWLKQQSKDGLRDLYMKRITEIDKMVQDTQNSSLSEPHKSRRLENLMRERDKTSKAMMKV